MRYLAIDYGTKRTGLAICDQAETIASPLTVIQGQKELIKNISEVLAAANVDAVVLGLPLNMDGSEGPQAKLVLKFGKQLQNCLKIPVLIHDDQYGIFYHFDEKPHCRPDQSCRKGSTCDHTP